MNNKKIGNEYEQKMLDYLSSKGYWAHLFAYNPLGQPCDIVASKDDLPFLIDVKHCAVNRFNFHDIRDNQINCFELFREKGNSNCCFVIFSELQRKFYVFTYLRYKTLVKNGAKSVELKDENTDLHLLENYF